MDQQAKQQVIERIKTAENILVTVSTDPSVDQLAACIGTALMINRMQKRGTAIYSGKTPSTIEFLQPEKTLETNTDSLRDFIISLDKNKADKLRYKVEDKVVRIYITPYRTSISQKDLEFTQGDYNVDLILALGVKDKAHIDAAIAAHGRILHDAPTVAVNAGATKAPDIGQINWQDPQASSLCEMMVSISEALGSGLIDNQTATAFLTGIVAETERFSNSKTTSKVMTMSAQLMAAGANQQLIAAKLAPPPPEPPPAPKPVPPAPKKPTPPPKDSGEITIEHSDKKKAKENEAKIGPNEIRIDERGNIEKAQQLLREKREREQRAAEAARRVAEQAKAPEPAPTLTPPAPPTPSPISSFRQNGEHDLFYMPKVNQPPPFAASGNESEAWYDPMSADQKSLSPDTAAPNEGFISRAPDVKPPEPVLNQVNHARSAVDSAYSAAPYDPTRPDPLAAINSQPLDDSQPLHPVSMPAAPPSAPAAPPAPPPVPPPIPFVPAPAAPSSAKQYNQNGTTPAPDSPNSAWPL